jgi:hypothetical protein
MAGSIAVLLANDEDWRILFLVPFGAAWIVAGIALVRVGRFDPPFRLWVRLNP